MPSHIRFSSESSSLIYQWPEPLTAKQLDQKYPGILDSTAFLAAAANIIMQLALPAVGYGVVESRVKSGSVLHHPFKRARTTFTYLAVAMMGTTEEKLAYRHAVNSVHRQVYSTETSPVAYNAFDPRLQLWVAACLYWGMVDAYQKIHRPLSRVEQEELYLLAQPLATMLQVQQSMWPADLSAFEQYWQDNLEDLHIDATIREFLLIITNLEFLPMFMQRLFGRFNRLMTTGFLPLSVRREMQLDWNSEQQQTFEKILRFGRLTMKLLPRPIRQAAYLLPLWDFRRRLARGKALV